MANEQTIDTPASPAVADIVNEPLAWYGEVKDPELGEWAKAKGFKDAPSTLASYRELEKTIGVDRLPMPEKDSDITKWQGWDKIGVPKDVKGYEGLIKRPEMPKGVEYDTAFEAKALEVAAQMRVHPKQVQGLIDLVTSERIAQINAAAAAEKADIEAYNREVESWGGAKDEGLALARRAAKEFGFKPESLEELAALAGSAQMIRAFKEIGKVLSEGRMVDGQSVHMTPDQANAEIKNFRQINGAALSDPRHPQNAELTKQLAALYKLAHPTGRVSA